MSSAILDIKYPEISKALYEASSVDEARIIYTDMLRNSGNIIHTQYAAKLEQDRKMLSVPNLNQLEKDFFGFKDHMRKWSRKTGIPVILQRRQKSFLGLNSKIRLYLSTGKNLSMIHDILGFRVILKTPYPESYLSILQCYDVLNETITFFSQKKAMFIEAEPRSGIEISVEKTKDYGIIIPDKNNLILSGFENNVKDYILHPKENGYQSLHLFVATQNGIIFEVQIRTISMDLMAEKGCALHSLHKKKKYETTNLGNIDFSKIHMPGFIELPTGEIYDKIGLQKSIDPFNVLQ